jgi:hypothetical protein
MPKVSRRGEHDPEVTERRGMSTEGKEVDEAETMASTGDESNAFQQIASGTATGLGVDRGQSVGTGGFAADEDLDAVAEGDWSRQWFQREPFEPREKPADHYDLAEHGHRRFGWETGADLDEGDLDFFEEDQPEDED